MSIFLVRFALKDTWCMAMSIHSLYVVQQSIVKRISCCSKCADQANTLLRLGTSDPKKMSLGPRTWIYSQLCHLSAR